MAGITLYEWNICRNSICDDRVLTGGRFQHLDHLIYQGPHVDGSNDKRGFTRIGKHLAAKFSGTFSSSFYLWNVFLGRVIAHLGQRAISHDDGKDIVEVVCDAAGQNTEALKPLVLLRLLFPLLVFPLGPFAVGYVEENRRAGPWFRGIGADLVVPVRLFAKIFKSDGFACLGDSSVGFDPEGVPVWHYLRLCLSQYLNRRQTGKLFESSVNLNESVIAGFSFGIGKDFVQSITGRLVLEQLTISLFALSCGRFALFQRDFPLRQSLKQMVETADELADFVLLDYGKRINGEVRIGYRTQCFQGVKHR